jgi:stearoyl-CoA desaturase (delta-9 desaturase)
VVLFHGTWFVNSAAHTWGYRNYESTGEQSTNLWWVALLSFGEGWHNNHHAHPRSAAHGLRWFELDPTYWTIKLMERIGLAHAVKLPAPEKMPRQLLDTTKPRSSPSPRTPRPAPTDQNKHSPEIATSTPPACAAFTHHRQ